MKLAPTPKDVIHEDGTARLVRFRPAGSTGRPRPRVPLLLVPSMINRWYVLDLREGASLAAKLSSEMDTYCLDWGIPEDEDRHLTWDDVLARLARAARVVSRVTSAPKIAILGYCMGGTLAGIHAALHPETVSALVNLAGPFDFSHAGFLGQMVDARHFDAGAIAAAGNVGPTQMQSGFMSLRPTQQIAKWVHFVDRAHDPKARESFDALEAWAGDNIPFPGAAYETYIKELYQENRLVRGEHYVRGRRVALESITCPVLSITAERDTICPPKAATALNDRCGSTKKDVLSVPGGHVGAVVGGKASAVLYPAIADWLARNAA